MREQANGQHELERYLLQTFGLEHERLQKVALFLLAHVLIDTRLIALDMFRTISEKSQGTGLSLPAIQAIADKASQGTFKAHLRRVRPMLSEANAAIAEELNRARELLRP